MKVGNHTYLGHGVTWAKALEELLSFQTDSPALELMMKAQLVRCKRGEQETSGSLDV